MKPSRGRPRQGEDSLPRPFLKWAGGKGQLLPELLPRVEQTGPFRRYHEPFVGGGALFFELTRLKRLEDKQVFLSDNNPCLIEAYRGVRDGVERVIALLWEHKTLHSKDYYYATRARVPDDPFERAARVIYLNKTCYNGLYRENSKGGFNVPLGSYDDPTICDEDNLRAAAQALRGVSIETRPFDGILGLAEPDDLVYFDPPYHPQSATSSFTKYNKHDFGEEEQRRLAGVFGELTLRGVKALLSNSMTPLVRELYDTFVIEEILATRAINSNAARRGKIPEALIRNFGALPA